MSWFSKQTTANKIGIFGLIISILALIWAVFSQLTTSSEAQLDTRNSEVTQNVSGNSNQVINSAGDVSVIQQPIDPRIEEIEKLLRDLSRIELLLPQNIGLNACVDSQTPSIENIQDLDTRVHMLMKVQSNCEIQLGQQGQAPAYLLAQNKSILQEISIEEPEIVEFYDDIHYFIAEIGNNFMIDRIWRIRGCSEDLWFVEGFNREQPNLDCLAAITGYSNHQEREQNDPGEKNHTDNLGRVAGTEQEIVNRYSSVSIVNAGQQLNEGAVILNEQTLNNYTVEHNRHAYDQMINSINGLREIIFSYRRQLR